MIHDNSKYTNLFPLYLPNDIVVILKSEDNRSYSYNFNILNMTCVTIWSNTNWAIYYTYKQNLFNTKHDSFKYIIWIGKLFKIWKSYLEKEAALLLWLMFKADKDRSDIRVEFNVKCQVICYNLERASVSDKYLYGSTTNKISYVDIDTTLQCSFSNLSLCNRPLLLVSLSCVRWELDRIDIPTMPPEVTAAWRELLLRGITSSSLLAFHSSETMMVN